MLMIDKKIKTIIENNPLALATVQGESPYVITVAYCKVVDKDKILITDNFMKKTVKNISENSNVALTIWNKRWEGYQFLGEAEYYNKGKWLDHVKNMKENKGMLAKGAILVEVKRRL